ncbi:hypothetical protein C0992_010236 [Termitomyces sp. T32_za158]|nr:hypothetical protein C0992_010236 [Termitomyces sp. T32_za158]
MNHGSEFQALWKQLRAEVRALQNRGYYGDGYWSSGMRLGDSARVSGQGIELGDLPEYLCGGSQTRRRPTRRPRKPRNATITPSTATGRQTDKPRKAGSRITRKNAFLGQGESLMGDEVVGKAKGTGFGKRVNSSNAPDRTGEPATDSDHDEVRIVASETDDDRREVLLRSNKDEDLKQLKSGSLWESFEFESDFVFDEPQKIKGSVCGLDVASCSTSSMPSKAEGKRKALDSEEDDIG